MVHNVWFLVSTGTVKYYVAYIIMTWLGNFVSPCASQPDCVIDHRFE